MLCFPFCELCIDKKNILELLIMNQNGDVAFLGNGVVDSRLTYLAVPWRLFLCLSSDRFKWCSELLK